MSANEYYSQKPLPDTGYYVGHAAASSSTPAPSYSSQQQHLAPGDRPPPGASPSPFDTVFDDHVYPASTYQTTPASSQHRLSQQDTSYPGPSPVHSDDIPLQNQAQRYPSKDAEMQDHVYDASQSRARRARVRFGELGMLGSNRKKIPFVVYFLTLVQVAVFIGELVKNGESCRPVASRRCFCPRCLGG